MIPVRKQSAFSLVELSVVLVILGLLVGGVLAGQSLIRAAELRAVSSEYSRYVAAVQAFRDKYFALPGDMGNASAFWGALDGNNGLGSDCRGESTSLLTCNGNGDGTVCMDSSCSAQTWEAQLFWKHLANAGLIEGSFSGAMGSTTTTVCVLTGANQLLPGCNVPSSKITQGFWHIWFIGQRSADPNLFDGSYGNSLIISRGPASAGGGLGLLTPEELWNIDTKLDDGRPGTGNLVVGRWNQCTTGAATVADFSNAQYLLNPPSWAAGNRCAGYYRNQF